MQIKYILNQIQKHKGFIYGQTRFIKKKTRSVLEIDIHPRQNSQPICSGCKKKGPGYDTQDVRHFEFVPLWGIAVFFLYAPRRVDCPRCSVTVEQVPWAEGKHHLTTTYAWFLARWAKRLSMKETAEAFQTTWDHVFRSVKMAVAWGLAHRNLENITAIGLDEIAWGKGPKYLTLVYQIDIGCRRLLWIGQKRTQKTLRTFFEEFGPEATARLRFICSDMWKPYLQVVAEAAGQAIHMDDLPDNGQGLIDCACGCIADVDDLVVAVQTDNLGHFRFEIPHLGQEHVDYILGRINLLFDAETLVLTETPSDFEGRFDLGDLGRTQALK